MAIGDIQVTEWPIPRPFNCDPKLYVAGQGGERCPHCRLWHLRPGYCMALDPMNAPANSPANTEPVSTPVSTDRKAYMRELMRAKRARERGGDLEAGGRDVRWN